MPCANNAPPPLLLPLADAVADDTNKAPQWAIRVDSRTLPVLVEQYVQAVHGAAEGAADAARAPASALPNTSLLFGPSAASTGAQSATDGDGDADAGGNLVELASRHEAETWRLLQVRF